MALLLLTHTMTADNIALTRQTTLEMLSIVDELPTLPDRFAKIKAVLDNTDSTLLDLTEIIHTDHATTATLLKVANSSFYNPLGSPVSSLSFAISRLGRQETGDIALSMSLLYGFAIPAGIAIVRGFWVHAFAVAQVSRALGLHINANKGSKDNLDSDVLFTSALLHDIGRVIISMRIDMSYFEHDFCTLDDEALISAEQDAYGVDHAEAGALVLKLWRLPASIYDIVASHHQIGHPSICVRICQFADQFVTHHLNTTRTIEDAQIKLREGLLEQACQSFSTDNKHGS